MRVEWPGVSTPGVLTLSRYWRIYGTTNKAVYDYSSEFNINITSVTLEKLSRGVPIVFGVHFTSYMHDFQAVVGKR